VLDDAGVAKDEVSEVVLVGGSTRIPKVRQILKRFFDGKEPNYSINPDEAVAYGAAVQAGVLSGEKDKKIQDLLLLDVTPLTLGIETTGGVMAPIIPRNTVVPTSKTKRYTTSEDNQVAVTNKVYEGERSLSKDNRLLGTFELSGFPPMPKGQAQIDVTFDLDANGILSVSAVESTSGSTARITIQNSDRLSPEEVARMVSEAEAFKDVDARALERVEARAALEAYVFECRKLLRDKDLRGRMVEDDADQCKDALDSTDRWIDESESSASKEEFQERLAELKDVKVGPVLERYGASPEEGSGGMEYDDYDSDAHDEL